MRKSCQMTLSRNCLNIYQAYRSFVATFFESNIISLVPGVSFELCENLHKLYAIQISA